LIWEALQELVDIFGGGAVVTQQDPQARVLDGDIASGLLHLEGGLDSLTLIVLELLLQAFDILLVTCTGAPLVVTNTDGGWVVRTLLLQGNESELWARPEDLLPETKDSPFLPSWRHMWFIDPGLHYETDAKDMDNRDEM
jgi:hypothetical protein